MTPEPNIKEVPITIENVVTPKKTPKEEKLFEKYKGWLQSYVIPKRIIIEFKRDVRNLKKSSLILLLFTSLSFGQASIVAAGNENETIGEVFPIMQTVDTIVQVSLSVPKYEIEAPKPIIKKKLTIFEKLMNFFKRIFK